MDLSANQVCNGGSVELLHDIQVDQRREFNSWHPLFQEQDDHYMHTGTK